MRDRFRSIQIGRNDKGMWRKVHNTHQNGNGWEWPREEKITKELFNEEAQQLYTSSL